MIPRVDVLGVGISAVNMKLALDAIEEQLSSDQSRYVCITGVHGVMESSRDPALREIHNSSILTTPDGMPMVWAARWAGAGQVERVYGPDLMLRVCELATSHGWKSFLYGGKPGVADLLASKLRGRFPGLLVVGTHSPPFRELTTEESREEVNLINSTQADIVWVGLSTPKQERWMARNIDSLTARLVIGVGAAFDIHAGLIPQAPGWMQRSGLEWLYRLVREPRRLWRRYLRNNPSFVIQVLRNHPRLIG